MLKVDGGPTADRAKWLECGYIFGRHRFTDPENSRDHQLSRLAAGVAAHRNAIQDGSSKSTVE
eukprot:258161-Pyramimonas_sp.AAC.1